MDNSELSNIKAFTINKNGSPYLQKHLPPKALERWLRRFFCLKEEDA